MEREQTDAFSHVEEMVRRFHYIKVDRDVVTSAQTRNPVDYYANKTNCIHNRSVVKADERGV